MNKIINYMLNITLLFFGLGRPVSKVERARPTQASSYTPGLMSMTQQLVGLIDSIFSLKVFENPDEQHGVPHRQCRECC